MHVLYLISHFFRIKNVLLGSEQKKKKEKKLVTSWVFRIIPPKYLCFFDFSLFQMTQDRKKYTIIKLKKTNSRKKLREIQHKKKKKKKKRAANQLIFCPNHQCSCFNKLSFLLIRLFEGDQGPSVLIAQSVKNLPARKRPGFDSWVGKIPWRRQWQPTPVFLSGESHGFPEEPDGL